MTRSTVSFLLALIFLISCGSEDDFVEARLKTADKFIDCLRNNTPDKILRYTYPGVNSRINDRESREFDVHKAYKFINKFGLPPKDKWTIKYDPHNNFDRLVVAIPLFTGYDTTFNLLKADMVISFPPPQISDKVYKFEINDEYKIVPIIAPPLRMDDKPQQP